MNHLHTFTEKGDFLADILDKVINSPVIQCPLIRIDVV